MPLSDRILLRLREGPASARTVAEALGADIPTVHRILRGLDLVGAVERRHASGEAARWTLALGVHVEYLPPRVAVTGAKPRLPIRRPARACRAINDLGRPCLLKPVRDDLCFVHAPPLEPPRQVRAGADAGQQPTSSV